MAAKVPSGAPGAAVGGSARRRGQQCKPPLQTLSGTKSLTPRRLRGPGDSRLRARTASWIRPRSRSRDTPSFASATSRTQHPWRLPFKGCWDAAILLPLPVPTKTSSLAKDHPPAHPAGPTSSTESGSLTARCAWKTPRTSRTTTTAIWEGFPAPRPQPVLRPTGALNHDPVYEE